MTFTEAAIEVLRREGKPLHFKKIAEIAVRENLLDHVGKVPDDTMADQLAAHCRLPHPERRLIPVQSGTFALVEWGMDEDPAGVGDLIEPPPEIDVPYRSRERHPIPSHEVVRGAPRGEARGRRREEEGGRPRRFPPPAEVAYEILAGAGRPVTVAEIAAQGAERQLMPEAFVRDATSLEAALAEDNRRRESGGRRPLFLLEGDLVSLASQPELGERPAVPAAGGRPVVTTPAEVRRAGLAALRRRLRECTPATVEHVACLMLEQLGFQDLKVAKRGREHVIYTGRRRVGLADVRHGIRILRVGGEVGRREVSELRRDLGHYGAQIGVVLSAGDAARDARGEATTPGQLPVVLLCGEALAEALAEAGVGCVKVVVPDVDEAFFRAAAEAAEKEESARRVRREERDRRDGRRRDERPAERAAPYDVAEEPAAGEVGVEVAAGAEAEEPALPSTMSVEPVAAARAGQDDDDDEDEGDDLEQELSAGGSPTTEIEVPAGDSGASEAGSGEAASGERRRRRRRRRRRGGRGRREGAAPGSEAPPAAGEAPAGVPAEAASAAAPVEGHGAGPSGDAPPTPAGRPAAPEPPAGGGSEG